METTLLFTFMLLVVMISADGNCPEPWKDLDCVCYKYIPEKVTWSEAQAKCWDEDSDLITIDSKAIDDFAVQLARSHGGGDTWIGLNDRAAEGYFLWANWYIPVYTNWMSGQPDNYEGVEDCAYLWNKNNYFWNDRDCKQKFSAICEKPCSDK